MYLHRVFLAVSLVAAASHVAWAQPVVLYSSNGLKSIEIIQEATKRALPHLQLEVVNGGTATLIKRIESEKANPVGDLFWGGGISTIGPHTGLMQVYRSPEARTIAPQFRDLGGHFIGTNVHVVALMVNHLQLQGAPAPRSWSDLMRPALKGKVLMADPSRSSSAFQQLYGLYQQFGRRGLERIAANVVVVATSSQVHLLVGGGEYAVGITLEDFASKYLEGQYRDISKVYPADGTYLAPEGMFILRGGKNPEGARQLYDLILSRPVQEALLRDAHRRPTRADIRVAELSSLPDLIDIKVFPLPASPGAGEYERVIGLWQEALVKAQRK